MDLKYLSVFLLFLTSLAKAIEMEKEEVGKVTGPTKSLSSKYEADDNTSSDFIGKSNDEYPAPPDRPQSRISVSSPTSSNSNSNMSSGDRQESRDFKLIPSPPMASPSSESMEEIFKAFHIRNVREESQKGMPKLLITETIQGSLPKIEVNTGFVDERNRSFGNLQSKVGDLKEGMPTMTLSSDHGEVTELKREAPEIPQIEVAPRRIRPLVNREALCISCRRASLSSTRNTKSQKYDVTDSPNTETETTKSAYGELIEDEDIIGVIENIKRLRRPAFQNETQYGKRDNPSTGWRRSKRWAGRVPAFGQGQTDEFPPPGRLRTPMKTAYRQIISAAPPSPYPRSKEALNLPLLSMNEPLTDTIIEDIREGVRYVLQTKSDFIIPIHGTGSTAISAILDNLIESGDRVVVGVNGYWGELMANMTSRLGAQLTILEKPVGTSYSLSDIDAALRLYRPKILALVHGESSSTIVQPLDGIGELCASQGVLLVVDTVATAGMQPILMDKYKIDAAFTSSHKGIGGVVGLGVVALSSRAVEKILQRRTPPHGYQTDLMIQAQLLNTADPGRVRFQSMSLPLLYAFREALANIVAEGKENVFSRHKRTSDQLSRGMEALGLEHFIPDPAMRLTSIVGFKIPMGKDVRKIATFMFQNHNIEISTGFGPTSGRMLRFAAFASNADSRKVNNIIRGMREALQTPETNLDERYYF